MIYDFNVWLEPWEELRIGSKSFDVRAHDDGKQRRPPRGGDVARFHQFDERRTGQRTGRVLTMRIGRVFDSRETPPDWRLFSAGIFIMADLCALEETHAETPVSP